MKRNGKRKNQIWMAGLLLCLGLVFLLPKEVKAEETDPEADTQIEYTVTKVPGKINMLAGETRSVSYTHLRAHET